MYGLVGTIAEMLDLYDLPEEVAEDVAYDVGLLVEHHLGIRPTAKASGRELLVRLLTDMESAALADASVAPSPTEGEESK